MKLYILFFISGIITSFLFPPFFLVTLGFCIFPFLLFLLSHPEYKILTRKKKFICGFIYGFGFLFVFLEWIREPFFLDTATQHIFFISYLLIFYCSFYFGIIFIIFDYFKSSLIKLLLLPLLIVSIEYLIGHIGYGFPWISFALIHSGSSLGPALIYYIGTYGLSYITILLFLFPSIFLYKRSKIKYFLISIYLIILILIFLAIFLRTITQPFQKDEISHRSLDITLVQKNFPINQKLDHSGLRLKHNAIKDHILNSKSDLIVFGENNFPYIINDLNEIKYLQNLIYPKSNLIIGATSKNIDKMNKDQNNYYNSFLALNNNDINIFNKKILVPFGEFIPLRNLFKFMEFIAGGSDFSVGNNERYIKINEDLSLMPVICYEILYFWRLSTNENIKSDIIVNLTNDSWFGLYTGPYQHFYFSRLRAAEFNKTLIRVSNNGISAIINNYGEIIDIINLNQKK